MSTCRHQTLPSTHRIEENKHPVIQCDRSIPQVYPDQCHHHGHPDVHGESNAIGQQVARRNRADLTSSTPGTHTHHIAHSPRVILQCPLTEDDDVTIHRRQRSELAVLRSVFKETPLDGGRAREASRAVVPCLLREVEFSHSSSRTGLFLQRNCCRRSCDGRFFEIGIQEVHGRVGGCDLQMLQCYGDVG